jgi:hypothetical protein
MRDLRPVVRWAGVLLVTIVACTGCTYAARQKLSPDERAEFHTYRKVMTAAQERAYLARTTAAERTAYLSDIGLAQRFQTLDPLDRDAVLGGIPRQGMSTEALRFLWGEPYSTAGDANRYAHWFYLGSSFALADDGNQYSNFGTRVDVYLVDGHVVGWVDYAPSSSKGKRRLL